MLRNRIDSCDYDLDQLLVGTILFTLLFFLLPTVVVFYLNFAIARMVIISMKAGFDTLLSCLNHFPLFALMLRIKDVKRLPGVYSTVDFASPTVRQLTLQAAFVSSFEIPKIIESQTLILLMKPPRRSFTSR